MKENNSNNNIETFSKFGNNFQQKLAKQIAVERTFADQIKEVLQPEMFELKYLQHFVKAIFSYKDKYEVHPSLQILDSILKTEYSSETNTLDQQIKEFYTSIVTEVNNSSITDSDDTEYVKDTALDFCKKQHLKGAIIKSIDLLQHASFDEIFNFLEELR